MAAEKVEGAQRVCSVCKTPLVCKKIFSTWNNQTSEKLQWQNAQDGAPHYYFVSKDNYSCNKPKSPEDVEKEQVVAQAQENRTAKIEEFSKQELFAAICKNSMDGVSSMPMAGPHIEAQMIATWAVGKAHSITRDAVENYQTLSPQEKSALGQKEGMLTRLLADLLMKLREMNGIKSKYGEVNGN